MKHLNQNDNNVAQANITSKDEWLIYYYNSWFDSQVSQRNIKEMMKNMLGWEELESTSVQAKNRKALILDESVRSSLSTAEILLTIG